VFWGRLRTAGLKDRKGGKYPEHPLCHLQDTDGGFHCYWGFKGEVTDLKRVLKKAQIVAVGGVDQ
jgi:hypothetical protein